MILGAKRKFTYIKPRIYYLWNLYTQAIITSPHLIPLVHMQKIDMEWKTLSKGNPVKSHIDLVGPVLCSCCYCFSGS